MSAAEYEELRFEPIEAERSNVVELTSGTVTSERDATDLVGNASYLEAEYLLVDAARMSAEFFDLSSGLAGAVMQKFANYRVCLVVVGYDSAEASESMRALIRESNRGGTVWFVADRDEALARIRGAGAS